MTKNEIEGLPEVIEAAKVLAKLEERGLVQPVIAGGWTRSFLTDSSSPDIDVSYVGGVSHEYARKALAEALVEINASTAEIWDVEGIWGASESYGVSSSAEHLLRYYVDSIDSIFLASNGKLHDPTGCGFVDAEEGILRINNYDHESGIVTTASEEVNICLEGCRRIAQLGWRPTQYSVVRIQNGVDRWGLLSEDELYYFVGKLGRKFKSDASRIEARSTYSTFVWSFIFNYL